MLSRLVIIGGSEEGGEAGSTGAAWTILAEETQNQIIATAGTEDLDFIEKIINEVDRPVKQVLIEAIIVKATDTFQEELGARLGGALNPGIGKNTDGNTLLKQFRGIQNDSEASATPDSDDQTFATASSQDAYNADRIANFGLSAPTMGLGIIADIGFAELKGEIFTMQSEGLTKTVDNPKVFVLDNQEASIISGSQIAYSGGGADSKVEMVDAALSLTVTPQIVGDGNIKLALKVNNDSPSGTGANPPISKLSIDTGLIIKDGDVVVIGGVFANTQSQKENKVPILGDIPVLGRLFRSDAKVDNQEQVLIFIAPRVL
jgi:type IV pilus assembly protein PilQ